MKENVYEPEISILEETPYNWKKHLIFQIPEMIDGIVRITFIFVVLDLIAVSIITAGISVALDRDLSTELKDSYQLQQ